LTELVHEDGQLFFAASNNATYLGTQQPAQQFEISRFSAIAHQRSMVVATTSGVSGLVSPNGDVSNQIVDTGGKVFLARVGLFDGRTFADTHPLFQYLFIVALVPLFVIRRIRIKPANSQEDRSSE
jgi:apolipoprotein N-acyltransferase